MNSSDPKHADGRERHEHGYGGQLKVECGIDWLESRPFFLQNMLQVQ